jgi:hypothetical protein
VIARNISIPYLARNPLVVVVGPEAHTAVERLQVAAAVDGVRCIEFTSNVFISAERYAQIIKDTARAMGRPALLVPMPGTEKMFTDLADLIIQAPAETENRVFLVAGTDAFSIQLPAFPAAACALMTPLILEGAVMLTDTHRARPTVQVAPALLARLEKRYAQPSGTVH